MGHAMRRMLVCSLCIVTILASHAVRCEEAPKEYNTVTLAERNGFVFRLRYLPRASIADEHWLILEMENQNNTDFQVDVAYFRVEYHTSPTGNWRGGTRGTLVDCSSREIFARDGKLTDQREHTLGGGQTHKISVPISNQGASNLPLPPFRGRASYRGRVRMSIEISYWYGARVARIDTPGAGTPFTFEWERPNVADTDDLENRLRRILAEPVGWTNEYDLIPRLFELPDVAARFSDEELLELFTVRGIAGAETVLYMRDPRNQAVRNWYRENLGKEKDSAIYRLEKSPYAAEFIPTLFSILEASTSDYNQRYAALKVLRRRSDDWGRNPAWVAIFRRAYADIRPYSSGTGSTLSLLIGILIMAMIATLTWVLNKWGVNKDKFIQARGRETFAEPKNPGNGPDAYGA